jgi:class 3 adenylate cyclase
LFTDIETSVRLWDRYPEAMSRAVLHHDRAVQRAIRTGGGRVFARTGDGFGAVFAEADAAIETAVCLQGERLDVAGVPLRIRIGIHTGRAEQRARNFYGPTVNYTARLTEAAAGGEILVSGETVVASTNAAGARRLGDRWLRDLSKPMTIYQVAERSFQAALAPITSG